MNRPDGGPAFPGAWGQFNETGGQIGSEGGMSLRDYFAAHAPVEPQTWFVPLMPEPCPKEPSWSELTDPEEKRMLREYGHEWLDDEEARAKHPKLAEFSGRVQAARLAGGRWKAEFERQRLIQWPYAWADAMIAERGRP